MWYSRGLVHRDGINLVEGTDDDPVAGVETYHFDMSAGQRPER